MRPAGPLALLALLATLVAGCTQDPAPPEVAPTGTVSPGTGLAPVPIAGTEHSVNLPEGWTASVYARVPKARFLLALPDGAVLVSRPDAGRVMRIPPGGGEPTTFLSGLDRPHDLVLATVGGRQWIYVAAVDRVVRYPLAATAGAPEVIVDGLPDESLPELGGKYGHVLKNIALDGDTLYVSIASTCNACASDTVSDPIRGSVYRWDAAGHNTGKALVAKGLRNAEGLAIAPGTHDLWVVVNNRDNIIDPATGRKDTAYVDNHPPEEFIKIKQGGFYGWPFCNPDPSGGLRDMPFQRDYELNRGGEAADCGAATPVDVGIQAHSAPLGLTFVPSLGAVIALHGSWNRSQPTGYKVINFPWVDGRPGDQHDLATGFLGAESPWARPVDIALLADGSLLVSDDFGGNVFRFTPPPG
ncbi:gluconolaconase [Asanoa sp. NPDC049518]|uniref:PQQ-dependent sugar dehydrogenase n=1 Tax=unclassified Asanoa TaxID=2685164 RepID=UPI0034255E26